jgi:hypothetical protein
VRLGIIRGKNSSTMVSTGVYLNILTSHTAKKYQQGSRLGMDKFQKWPAHGTNLSQCRPALGALRDDIEVVNLIAEICKAFLPDKKEVRRWGMKKNDEIWTLNKSQHKPALIHWL